MGVQILGEVGARHILVGACRNFHYRHHLYPTVHQLGEVLPYLGVVVTCSNSHLMKKVAWYLAVEMKLGAIQMLSWSWEKCHILHFDV